MSSRAVAEKRAGVVEWLKVQISQKSLAMLGGAFIHT